MITTRGIHYQNTNRLIRWIGGAILCSMVSNALSQDGFTLIGIIPNCSGCKISIQYDGQHQSVEEETIVRRDTFVVQGILAEPQVVQIRFEKTFEVFLANGDTTLLSFIESEDQFKVIHGDASIDYLKFCKWVEPYDYEMVRLDSQLIDLGSEASFIRRAPLLKALDSLRFEHQKAVSEFVVMHPRSKVGVFALVTSFISKVNTSLLERALYALDSSFYSAADWIYLRDEILIPNQLSEPGKLFPLSLLDELIASSGLLEVDQKPYLLVDFWASWCQPCRRTNRELISLYDSKVSDRLKVISISLDTNRERWEMASQKDGIRWTNICDLKGFGNRLAKALGIKAIPSSFLMDNSGIIVARDPTISEIEKYIHQD